MNIRDKRLQKRALRAGLQMKKGKLRIRLIKQGREAQERVVEDIERGGFTGGQLACNRKRGRE